MRITSLTAAALAALIALPAAAEGVKVYPYASNANYCPAGLQPISIAGVICCGKPNQSITYQQAKASPTPRRAPRPAAYHPTGGSMNNGADVCEEGEKGCR